MPDTLSIIYLSISVSISLSIYHLFIFAPPLHPLHSLLWDSASVSLPLPLPSPSSSLPRPLPSTPSPPSRALAKCAKLAACFFSTSPSILFEFSECITNCPLCNTCTGIMPKSYLLHPNPKATSVQRSFLTKTASPRRETHTHVQAHTHPNLTPIFLLNLRQYHSNVFRSTFESSLCRMPRHCRLLRNTVLVILPHPHPNQVSKTSFKK